MANPFGYGQTYIPQYQQGINTPSPTAFQAFGSPQPTGGAQGQATGTPGDIGMYNRRDQSLLPGLQNDFQPGSNLDSQYFTQMEGSWGGGAPRMDGGSQSSFSVSMPTPISNIPEFLPGKDPFSAAQQWYSGYVNNLRNYQQNYLPGYQSQLQNDYNAYRAQNNSSAFSDPTLRAPGIAGLNTNYNNAITNAAQKYLELYNKYGQSGAFGSGFQNRTVPINFGG